MEFTYHAVDPFKAFSSVSTVSLELGRVTILQTVPASEGPFEDETR